MVTCAFCSAVVTRSEDVVQRAGFRAALLRERSAQSPAPQQVELKSHAQMRLRILAPLGRGTSAEVVLSERMTLWQARAELLVRRSPPRSAACLHAHLARPGNVILEGAQGLLLDQWHGFHPHTTWSSVGPVVAAAVLHDLELNPEIETIGVIRSYLTRHGAGPLPTHDAALDIRPERHNAGDGWQGPVRRGHPDAVLLRYAHAVAGRIDALAVTHLDVFRHTALRWCESYRAADSAQSAIHELPFAPRYDLGFQHALTQTLRSVTPCYVAAPVTGADALLEHLGRTVPWHVRYRSFGPTHAHVVAN